MPFGFITVALQIFLRERGVDLATITALGAVSLPWSFKFLWSPLIDRFALPWQGRRRGWVLLAQWALAAAFGALAVFAARAVGTGADLGASAVAFIGALALGIAFLSATQDIALDAYAVEILRADEQGPAAGLRAMYYRLGMLLAGALAVFASQWVPWPYVFAGVGLLFALMTALTLLAREPESPAAAPRSLGSAVIEPLRSFFKLPHAVSVALFLVLYKFGDSLGYAVVNPLLKDLGFSNAEIGIALKVIGFAATIGGSALGAAVMAWVGLGRALWLFGAAQALSCLLYAGAALSGGAFLDPSLGVAVAPMTAATRLWTYAAIAGEQGAQAMASAALGALILRVCDKRYGATQYALLSSLFGLGRSLAGVPSGALAQWLGYPAFFALAVALSAPGFALLQRIAPLRQRDVQL